MNFLLAIFLALSFSSWRIEGLAPERGESSETEITRGKNYRGQESLNPRNLKDL